MSTAKTGFESSTSQKASGDANSSSIISTGDEWEDLGASGTRSSAGQSSTLGSIDSDVINLTSSLPSATSSAVSDNTSSMSPYADELERLLMEAQREGGSSRGTSIRSSSGPHSPVWSTGGGTGFSSPVFLQNSASQSKLEAALQSYSSRPECTPLKPHELAERFRHPNGGGQSSEETLLVPAHYRSNNNHPMVISEDDVSSQNSDSSQGWLQALSSSLRTIVSPPFSYFLIPTHIIMFGLGAFCAYICFARRVFGRWR